MIRVIPVLDVRGGVVVHGVAGRRDSYRPLVTSLTASTAPTDLARAFRERLGLENLYVADLDALMGGSMNAALYRELAAVTPRLWVDAGLRRAGDAAPLVEAGVAGIVAALESLDGPAALAEMAAQLGSRLIFSLDLRDGLPVTQSPDWGTDPFTIAVGGVRCGVCRLLLLDVSRVGLRGGSGTEELCRRVARAFPDVELATGGGINTRADLDRLQHSGVHAALVATALHDGRLTREDVAPRPNEFGTP